jgi:hypothetical protein
MVVKLLFAGQNYILFCDGKSPAMYPFKNKLSSSYKSKCSGIIPLKPHGELDRFVLKPVLDILFLQLGQF